MLKVNQIVEVKNGFYEGQKGIVIGEIKEHGTIIVKLEMHGDVEEFYLEDLIVHITRVSLRSLLDKHNMKINYEKVKELNLDFITPNFMLEETTSEETFKFFVKDNLVVSK